MLALAQHKVFPRGYVYTQYRQTSHSGSCKSGVVQVQHVCYAVHKGWPCQAANKATSLCIFILNHGKMQHYSNISDRVPSPFKILLHHSSFQQVYPSLETVTMAAARKVYVCELSIRQHLEPYHSGSIWWFRTISFRQYLEPLMVWNHIIQAVFGTINGLEPYHSGSIWNH